MRFLVGLAILTVSSSGPGRRCVRPVQPGFQHLGLAQLTDPNLQDPWGVSFSTGSPLWVSDQAANVGGSSVTTLYSVNGKTGATSIVPVAFGIPNQGGAPPSGANGPTGQVNTSAPGITTSSTDFQVNGAKAAFIFANMDGSISAWNGGAKATIVVQAAGASYTGLAIGNDKTGAALIYAADQTAARSTCSTAVGSRLAA